MAKIDWPELEERILKFWQEKKIFQKTIDQRQGAERFVFYEGPPTANGKPGIHHVLARAFKDLFPRYKTMRGYLVERKAGWDTHGLPVELQVEKELGLQTKKDVEAYGVEAFNKKCRESVWLYKEDWEKLTERIAFWLDMDNPYITYKNDYIETLWWIFKKIWDAGLVYQDYKVIPFCTRCGTALSSHEVAQGYEDVTEPSVYVKFRLKEDNQTSVLAWTTTPWKLPGNVALAVGGEIDYVKVKIKASTPEEEYLILAKDRLDIIEEEYEVVEKFKGKELEGKEYEPLYPVIPLEDKHAYYLALAPFVSTEEGTGVVHTAVMYGEDDFQLGKQLNLPTWHTVEVDGKFRPEVTKWAGQYVKDAEASIREDLQERDLLYKTVDYTHSYPFCWRCHTPLLYYAKESWYIQMTKVKKKLLANNESISWTPEHIKHGRFGDWLEGVKDWAISRERYWGTPIPIWQCENCASYRCIGSQHDLDTKLDDLHRPYIDKVMLKCECGGQMKRIKELFDVWFDSGAMPFAQWHYPFENKAKVDSGDWYPADYISEAIDQTRGWFYTLLAISTLLDRGSCYKNVICLGHINDAQGQKMSKSKGNIIDPWEVINQYGADSLRWHFFTINQPGETKNFDIKNVEEVVRKNFLILWNVYSFYEMFAGADKPTGRPASTKHVLDLWIMAKLQELVKTVTIKMENYDVFGATRPIITFIDELSTWYLRRSRDRFKGEAEADKQAAIATLHHVILTLSKLLAPFTPFVADELYQKLQGPKESVHLADWPEIDEKFAAEEVLTKMKILRQVVELGLAARAEAGFKVRQPLAYVRYQVDGLADGFGEDLEKLIQAELNVKEVKLTESIKKEADRVIKEDAGVKIALNTKLTPELEEEGWLREIIRYTNNLRKKSGLTIADRVIVYYNTESGALKKIIAAKLDSLNKETLSQNWEKNTAKVAAAELTEDLTLGDSSLTLTIETVS